MSEAHHGPQKARVLITVSGGVAEYFADSEVGVLIIDYDNEPDAVVPEPYRALLDAPPVA